MVHRRPQGMGIALTAMSLLLPFPLLNAAPSDSCELFLTPLIKAGQLEKARAAAVDSSRLSHVKTDKEVKSYSGYLTVDNATESNLFFWFFPAQERPQQAPVILWANEAAGYSCLKGIFLETGPFEVDDNGALVEQNHSWTKSHSILYIDAPVGTGFSFAKDESSYANNTDDIALEIIEALKQFFTLFHEFKERDFYLAGDTYATTTVPYIAKRIDAEGGINLKGFFIGSPFIHVEQTYRGEDYYELGLFDEKQRDVWAEGTKKMLELRNAGKMKEARDLTFEMYWGPNSLLYNYTGFVEPRSAITTKTPEEISKFEKFLDSKQVHNYLHVGLHKFVEVNSAANEHFWGHFFESHNEIIEELLDKGHRILFYAPQFDLFLTRKGVTDAVGKLKWKGAQKFSSAPRKIWRVGGEVAGYVKSADNLVFAMVRNAGNFAIMDQPEWTLDLVEKFLQNEEF